MKMSPAMQQRLTVWGWPALAALLLVGILATWSYTFKLERLLRHTFHDDPALLVGAKSKIHAKAKSTTSTLAAAHRTTPTQPAARNGAAATSGTPVTSATVTTRSVPNIPPNMPPNMPPGMAIPPSRPGQPGGPGPANGPGGAPPVELPKDLEQLVQEKGLFGKPPEQGWALSGILGDSALINGQWMKVGEPQGEAVVKEIVGSDKVVLEVKGQRQELTLWPSLPQ